MAEQAEHTGVLPTAAGCPNQPTTQPETILRRFDASLEQGQESQRHSWMTTLILAEHQDEVWDLQWSHNGCYLATVSLDQTAIIWHIETDNPSTERKGVPDQVLGNHWKPVNGVTWSPDDETLLTCANKIIKMWRTKIGVCVDHLEAHTDIVTALEWFPDGSGFISAGMDSRIIFWDNRGKLCDAWDNIPIRIVDISIAPDSSRLVAVGVSRAPITASQGEGRQTIDDSGAPQVPSPMPIGDKFEKRIMVWSWPQKRVEASITLEGFNEVTSVKTSRDSRYAIVNHAPDEVQLWDLGTSQLARKFTGQKQSKNVIRSCFGGVDEQFVVSGSEDGRVYVWYRDTGELLEVLEGHGTGCVNSVAWNPRDPRIFASCSDDRTIRIWKAPTTSPLNEETS